jgi:hypothetical protein
MERKVKLKILSSNEFGSFKQKLGFKIDYRGYLIFNKFTSDFFNFNSCKKVLIAKEDKEQSYLTPDFYMRFIDESEEDKRAFDLIRVGGNDNRFRLISNPISKHFVKLKSSIKFLLEKIKIEDENWYKIIKEE